MTKFKTGVIMTIVVALLFAFFWGGIFSIRIPTDWLFLIGYALVLTGLILLFRKVEKPAIYIGIAVMVCVMTLVSLIGYRAWNRKDFYIDADEVEKIIYRNDEGDHIIGDDEESIKNIVNRINKAYCVKKWDVEQLGEIGTSLETVYVMLENGEHVSIDTTGCVDYSDRDTLILYKMNIEAEDFFVE